MEQIEILFIGFAEEHIKLYVDNKSLSRVCPARNELFEIKDFLPKMEKVEKIAQEVFA